MGNNTQLLTPVGRLVMGDCWIPQTTDAENNPLVIKSGPNAGQPRVDYYMGLAIAKTDTGYNELYAKIHNEARTAFPSLFDASGNCISPKFAFKIIDGDSQIPNTKGNKPCDREGFPGHWILSFSSGYAPKCYIVENGEHKLVTDPNTIKRGYYIRIYGSVAGNGSQQQPGIFLNHSMVELVGYGAEIISGPDANSAFGAAVALPQGASATPLASAAVPMAVAAPVPMGHPAPPVVPAQPVIATPAPVAAPAPGQMAPAPEFLNPAGAVNKNVNGQVHSVADLKANGWNDDQIAALPNA